MEDEKEKKNIVKNGENNEKEKTKNINLKVAIILAVIIISLILIIFIALSNSSKDKVMTTLPGQEKPSILDVFEDETENINNGADLKPIIYLYPTEEMDISVNLLNSDRITCSYPKYKDIWNVHAKPNGDLKDLNTGRNLYSLYYESDNFKKFNVIDEGFVVKGEDSAKFLEEKLSVLGLTDREAEEFIVYWLPKLESNKYNYIRFATEDEINNNMSIGISPKPDTFIRILMTFKGLDNPIEVKEQKLDANIREGYTIVEWGGTEIL